jgi:ABC-type Fe3+/spermidine/putrescine transport system ATPase subunit
MTNTLQASPLQQAIDVVEALSSEDQQLLLEILLKRLQRQRRQQLVKEVQDVHQEVAQGAIQFGSVQDFLTELDA